MTYEAVPARFALRLGWTAAATVFWGEHGSCSARAGEAIGHVGRVEFARGEGATPDGVLAGYRELHPDACEACGAPFDPDVDHDHSAGTQVLYDTPSGKLEPGCLFWGDWLPHTDRDDGAKECWTLKESDGVTIRSRGWTNCTGRHLMAVCPDGAHWDVDARASNCGRPDDTTHRCWVRSGDPEADPPTVHVDKDGDTCAAGAGSIATGDYHGFLRHGVFTAG